MISGVYRGGVPGGQASEESVLPKEAIPIWHSRVNAGPRSAALVGNAQWLFVAAIALGHQLLCEQRRNQSASMIRPRSVPQRERTLNAAPPQY